jgi:transposase
MTRPIAPDYGQTFLLTPCLEDWVPSDHPARFIREFVDQQDLQVLGFKIPQALEGRPPYAPSLLLKIWLYGYFQRIRSTRKLEAACQDHLPMLWLCGLNFPDHNTLWRFWRDNCKPLRQLFKQTVQVALKTGAVGLALQALDGTKIPAACSGPKGWSKEYMEKMLVQLDQALEKVELEVVQENSNPNAELDYRLPAGLAQRQALREQIRQGLAQLKADGRSHHHRAEPEARRMKVGDTNRFAYNAQAIADQKEGILLACEVTRQENDNGQLVPMIEQAQQNLGPEAVPAQTVADSGYGTGADIKAAADKGLAVLVPSPVPKSASQNPYAAQHFTYDPSIHTVSCPTGHKLDHEGQTHKRGQTVERFRCHKRDCPVRQFCTQDPKGRQIEVWPHQAEVQQMRKLLEQPALQAQWRQRSQIIEPRFAQLKEHDGFRRWTVWGLDNVRTQWSLLCATLNLRVLYRRWKAGLGGPLKPVAAGLIGRAEAMMQKLCRTIRQAAIPLSAV